MASDSVSILELARAYNDIDEYPTLEDVSREFGIAVKTVKNRIGVIRREHPQINLIKRAMIGGRDEDVVFSEKPSLYMPHWTGEDCITLLRNVVMKEPDRVISRNYFNSISGISESTWNRYFGTFEEFKRQASVKLARGPRSLELNIAKHASRDFMNPFNEEKRSYAGKYVKDHPGRFKTVVVGSDFHDLDCDPFVRRTFLDTCRRIQPECVFLNGDMLDLPEFGRYTVDPRTWDVLGRIEWMHKFLGELREYCPETHIVYLEGNHEFRMIRHMSEATPALKTILADLHGFTVASLLKLDQYEIEYVAKADLRAWTNRDVKRELHKNSYLLWNQLLGDHFPDGKKQGVPGWNGHHHQLKVESLYTRQFGSSQWVQLPSGHVGNAEYCNGEKWNTGFMIVHADTFTGHSVFEPVEVRDFCVVGGEYYYRHENEAWFKDQTTF
ncbi:MAG: hypothetical protein NXH70_02515 [Hyphomonas sp.]|nr:hypothetical protein [Hyphomonas sp.]